MKVNVDVVIPVYNEEVVLEKNIIKLNDFLTENFKHNYKIVIADNASTDNTLNIAKKLSSKFNNINYIHLDEKGRGRALRTAWMNSNADVLSYMDADLSTDLTSFPELINSIVDNYDIAIGSRHLKQSNLTRCFKRDFFSYGYNYLVDLAFFTKFADVQCGFKAIKKDLAEKLIPLIKSQEWFFDTELLVIARKKGYKIKEIPVKWVESADSKVNIPKTVMEYLKNISRLRFRLWFKLRI